MLLYCLIPACVMAFVPVLNYLRFVGVGYGAKASTVKDVESKLRFGQNMWYVALESALGCVSWISFLVGSIESGKYNPDVDYDDKKSLLLAGLILITIANTLAPLVRFILDSAASISVNCFTPVKGWKALLLNIIIYAHVVVGGILFVAQLIHTDNKPVWLSMMMGMGFYVSGFIMYDMAARRAAGFATPGGKFSAAAARGWAQMVLFHLLWSFPMVYFALMQSFVVEVEVVA